MGIIGTHSQQISNLPFCKSNFFFCQLKHSINQPQPTSFHSFLLNLGTYIPRLTEWFMGKGRKRKGFCFHILSFPVAQQNAIEGSCIILRANILFNDRNERRDDFLELEVKKNTCSENEPMGLWGYGSQNFPSQRFYVLLCPMWQSLGAKALSINMWLVQIEMFLSVKQTQHFRDLL